MCLPDFIRFDQVNESDPIIGYRSWKNEVDSLDLKSQYINYIWTPREGPHEVRDVDSGIYSYNYYNHNNYNYYNNYDYNHNNYNYNNYYDYYNLAGIISQWGRIAIHKDGQRSEYAKIDKLFTIRDSDALGPDKFLIWIRKFNSHIIEVANRYEISTISWQDFLEEKKK